MPHAVCWRQDPALVWTMVITNAITFLSYFAICLTLFYLARRTRRVIASDWAFFVVGFALFIVACGLTHLMEVVTTWSSVFWVDAWTNIVTAVLSGYVAVQFFRRAQAIGFGLNDYSDRLADTEHEKARMQNSLLAAQKLEDWSRMSTAVTHEIANPLETVQNLLYLIREGGGTRAEMSEWAQLASEEAQRVLLMVRSTMGFFRQTSEPEPIDLRLAAESVRLVLSSALRERKVDMEVHANGDVHVHALPGEPRQVLLNLVRNGIEATPRGGAAVEVSLEGTDDFVEITVADGGQGIDSSLLPSLFQFGVSTKGAAGNGMGLWTVRQLIAQHGGTIHVDSTPGEGTRFTVRWPRRYSSPTAPARPEPRIPLAALAAEAAREVFPG